MHRLGVSPAELHQLLSHAQDDVATSGLTKHVGALLTDLFRGTFFELDGWSARSCVDSRGTRPGDPVGDILFNLLMVIIMKDMTNTMCASSQATWLGSGAPISDLLLTEAVADHAFCEVAFVDDVAVLVRAPDIDGMFALATSALQAVHAAAAHRGLAAWQAKIRLADQDHLLPVDISAQSHSLWVVQIYRHLGGWVHADAQPRHAIRDCITAAKQAWGPLVRPFFRKKAVALATKVQVMQSLVVSKLTYNMHVLTKLSSSSTRMGSQHAHDGCSAS